MKDSHIISKVLIFIIPIVLANEFPTDIERCHFGDVNCIKDTIFEIFRKHPDGHKGLHLPRIEPYHIDTLQVNQNGNSSVTMDLLLTDVEIAGMSNIKVDKVVGFGNNPEKSKYEIFAKAPRLQLSGNYKMTGRILVLPINGEGLTNSSLTNVTIGMKMKPRMYTKDGKRYLKMEKFKLKLDPEKVVFFFSNLFNGDAVLSQTLNNFLRENSLQIWNETKGAFIEAITSVFKSIINSVLEKYSYNELFLEDK